MTIWEKGHPPVGDVRPAAVKFPSVDSRWDNNNLGDQAKMHDLRELIIQGKRKSTPR